MTLAISYFDPSIDDVDEGFIGMAEMSGDLFGFESWRSVWGSKEVLQRGGSFLSRLKAEDLYVYPDELTAFKLELELIDSQSEDIAKKLNIDSEDIKFRLNNAIEACKVAGSKGYGVCIS